MNKDHIDRKILRITKKSNISTRNLALEIGLSQTATRYRLSRLNISTNQIHRNNKGRCITCNRGLTGYQVYFCSISCKSKHHSNSSYESQIRRGTKRRNAMIAKLGGKCSICEYSGNSAALVFHHKDPASKELSLDIRGFSNFSMERILKEVRKCQLICHNCHMDIHHPVLST